MVRAASQPSNNSTVALTSTGFTQGDLVYYRGSTNDYCSVSGLSATGQGNFNFSRTTGLMSNGVGTAVRPVFGATDGLIDVTLNGGSAERFADVLTNGNIVQVFGVLSNGNRVAFRIVDQSGTVVVAPTVVSPNIVTATCKVGVRALTGGGFVVYFSNSDGATSNRPCYAIYSNTGAVVTSVVNDTSLVDTIAGTNPLRGVALPNGGFALAVTNASGAVYYRAFTATGVGSYTWVNLSTSTGSNAVSVENGASITARSDNFIVIAYRTATPTTVYAIINTSGVLVTNGNFSMVASTNVAPTSLATLSDGTTVVIGYINTVSGGFQQNCFRILPSSAILGPEVGVPTQNYLRRLAGNYDFQNSFISILPLSAGGFFYAFTDLTLAIQYVVFNSSGVPVSGVNSIGALPRVLPSTRVSPYMTVTAVQFGGNINLYWSSQIINVRMDNQHWARINDTTYEPVLVSSSTQVVGSVAANLGAPVVSTATPTSTRFSAANTELVTFTGGLPGVIGSAPTPTLAASFVCNNLASATLPNGNVLICYQRSFDNVIFVNVYSPTMVLQQTITANASISSSFYLKIAALSNGGFVVGYFSAANTYSLDTYNSSYAFVATSTVTGVSNANGTGVGLSGLSNGKFVFSYVLVSSTDAAFIVYSNTTGAVLTASTTFYSGGALTSCVAAGNNYGGFYVSVRNNSTNNIHAFTYLNSTGNTYVGAGNTTITSATAHNSTAVYTPGGAYVGSYNISNNFATYALTTNQCNFVGTVPNATQTVNTFANFATGLTGNGSVVTAVNTSGSVFVLTAYTGGVAPYTSDSAGLFTFGTSTTSITSTAYTFRSPTGTGSLMCVTPGQGYNAIIAWLNTSGVPNFINVNVFTLQDNVQLTAGSSATNAQIPISPYSSPLSPVVQNAVLAGVAGSTASAGGSGVVINRGAVQLNSNYPSGTAPYSFDYQSPNGTGVPGVKGTISGRNVVLQGVE